MTGQELREFRKSLDMSQVQFGSELGISNPGVQISQLEHGARPITRRLEASIRHWKNSLNKNGKNKTA